MVECVCRRAGGSLLWHAENTGAPIVLLPACEAVIPSQERQARRGKPGEDCRLLHPPLTECHPEVCHCPHPQLQSPCSKILPGGRILTRQAVKQVTPNLFPKELTSFVWRYLNLNVLPGAVEFVVKGIWEEINRSNEDTA